MPNPLILEIPAPQPTAQTRVGEMLRPLSTLLGIAFLANIAWLTWRTDESKAHYYIAILNVVFFFGLRLILAKRTPAPQFCEPLAFVISLLVIIYAIAEAKMDKAPWSTTQIIMILLVGGFIFNNRNWLSALAAVACLGWFWAGFENLGQESWINLGASLLIAVIWAVWFLEIRLRTQAPLPTTLPKIEPAPMPSVPPPAKETPTETDLLRVRDDTTLFKERAAAAAKRAHILLRRQADLAAMAIKPGDTRNLEEILSIAAAAAHRWLPATIGAFILLRDQQTGRFTLGASSARGQFKSTELFSEHVLAGSIMVDRSPIFVGKIDGDDRFNIRSLYDGEKIESFAAHPMWSPEGLLGILITLENAPREYPPTETEYLTLLAHHCASSIILLRLQNARRA